MQLRNLLMNIEVYCLSVNLASHSMLRTCVYETVEYSRRKVSSLQHNSTRASNYMTPEPAIIKRDRTKIILIIILLRMHLRNWISISIFRYIWRNMQAWYDKKIFQYSAKYFWRNNLVLEKQFPDVFYTSSINCFFLTNSHTYVINSLMFLIFFKYTLSKIVS